MAASSSLLRLRSLSSTSSLSFLSGCLDSTSCGAFDIQNLSVGEKAMRAARHPSNVTFVNTNASRTVSNPLVSSVADIKPGGTNSLVEHSFLVDRPLGVAQSSMPLTLKRLLNNCITPLRKISRSLTMTHRNCFCRSLTHLPTDLADSPRHCYPALVMVPNLNEGLKATLDNA